MYIFLTPLSITTVYFCAGKFGAIGALASSIAFMYFPKIPGLIYSAKLTNSSVAKILAFKSFAYFSLINFILMALCFVAKGYFPSEKIWFLVCSPIYALIYLGITHFYRPFHKNNNEELKQHE
jgi:hypothetical protein